MALFRDSFSLKGEGGVVLFPNESISEYCLQGFIWSAALRQCRADL